uniref:transposase n=1 Tax=Candidatus Thiodubiliella endoseptemdiera TaxID=2738886 RepID=UPI003F69A5E6
MSWKQTAQNSFADSLVVEHKSLSEPDDVHNIINWPEIEQTLSNLYSSKRGAPSYPPLMMFKILILQAWYGLSDEALEKQIARGDLCINMNNHQNAIFHQITNFLKTPLSLLGVDLKNFQFNKICHFANHPYLCKGLS